jgi:YD repeat-containing protein
MFTTTKLIFKLAYSALNRRRERYGKSPLMKYFVRSTGVQPFRRRFDQPLPLVFLLATAVVGLATQGENAIAQTPQSSTTRYEYDANGNVTRVIDSLGRATVRRYDTSGRLVQQQLPSPAAGTPQPLIAYDYDGRDQLIGVIDPRSLATRYTIDGLGNQTGLASPDSGVATSTFDAAGRSSSTTDARGRRTTFEHDAAGRITRIGYANGEPSTFEYDAGSAGAIGRLAKMGDESGQTSYAYDGFGRVVSKTVAVGAADGQKRFTVGYSYGASGPANGKIVGISYPSGNQLVIDYGEDGRASAMSVRKPGAATPVALLGDIDYQPFGPVRAWQWE